MLRLFYLSRPKAPYKSYTKHTTMPKMWKLGLFFFLLFLFFLIQIFRNENFQRLFSPGAPEYKYSRHAPGGTARTLWGTVLPKVTEVAATPQIHSHARWISLTVRLCGHTHTVALTPQKLFGLSKKKKKTHFRKPLSIPRALTEDFTFVTFGAQI